MYDEFLNTVVQVAIEKGKKYLAIKNLKVFINVEKFKRFGKFFVFGIAQ